MPSFTFVGRHSLPDEAEMSRITDLAIATPGGGDPILYATTRYDGILSSWSIDGPVSLTATATYPGGDSAGSMAGLGFVGQGSGSALLTGGGAGSALTLRALGATGSLGPAQTLNGAGFGGDLVETVTVTLDSGAQAVFGGIAGRSGIAGLTFTAAGSLTGSSRTADSSTTHADRVTALAEARIGGVQYLFSASTTDPGVTSWRVQPDGTLVAVDSIAAADNLWIAAPTAMAAAVVDGRHFLILTAAGSGSVSVVEVTNKGMLRVTDHVIDDLFTRFDGASALATVTHEGQTYLVVGGADDGISVMQLLPGGQLIARAHIEDTTAAGLANISAITARSSGGVIEIFAASSSETGITELRFEPGTAGITRMTAFPGETVTGTTGNDIFTGGAGDDRLFGGAGDDIMMDGAGSDTLTGGPGADIFVMAFDGENDRILDFVPGEDQIDLSAIGMLRNIGQLRMATSASGLTIRFGDEVLAIVGRDGPITPAALGLGDLLNLSHVWMDLVLPGLVLPVDPTPVAGDLVGTTLADSLSDQAATGRRIFGLQGHDDLTGGAGADSIYGATGDDVIDGGSGADHLQGGAGNDTYVIRDAGSTIVDAAGQGTADRVMAAQSFALATAANVEILQTISAAATTAINLTGNHLAQHILGNAGDNVLMTGWGAADRLEGLGGNDTYRIGNAADIIIESAGQGSADRVMAAISFALSADDDIEIMTTTYSSGTGSINLTGNGLVQSITGNQGINVLGDGGGAGADRLAGLGGNDTYVIRNAATLIDEVTGGADRADVVSAAVSFRLAADDGIELMQTTNWGSTAAINLTGNARVQFITGNQGANVLEDGAGSGADRLTGLGGNDSYVIRNAATQVIETAGQGTDRVMAAQSFALATAANVEILQTISAAATTAINLTGNHLAQRILGNAGDNVLMTGWGAADRLEGLGGNDTYRIGNAADIIIESAGQGSADRVMAAISFALSADDDIEIMTTTYSSGTGSINLTGNGLVQSITGNQGINVLGDGGGAGADRLTGLGGNDTYVIRNAATLIDEVTGGADRADVVSAAVSFRLAADDGIELMQTTNWGSTAAINLTGNARVQFITGNQGANVLEDGAGSGADRLTGLGGNDTYVIRNAATQVIETAGQGTDRVMAAQSFALATAANVEILQTISAAAATAINLTGNHLAQQILGNAGGNRIDGKGGQDILTGGAGADRFVFSDGMGSAHLDTITDFTPGRDRIWLSDDLFAALASGTLSSAAFRANTTGLAQDASDRIIYESDSGYLYHDRDGTGAGTGVRFALLDARLALTSADMFVF